jgi:hypothetical protein
MDIGDIDPQEWAAAQRRAEVLSKLPERPSGERPGLAALAGGSLLQNYALAVAVARLTEYPVEQAAAALAAADVEGETNLRRVLGAWPSATRRRIDVEFATPDRRQGGR